MTIPHIASYATPAFDVVQHLRTHLDGKRSIQRGQFAEIERLQKASVECDRQIADIEAALMKLTGEP